LPGAAERTPATPGFFSSISRNPKKRGQRPSELAIILFNKNKAFPMTISRPIGKEDIEYRVDNWKERLTALMDQLEEWARELGFETQRGEVKQWTETLMEEHGVEPRMLPTLTVSDGEKKVLFTPSHLWI
jgi:hypothetical protein